MARALTWFKCDSCEKRFRALEDPARITPPTCPLCKRGAGEEIKDSPDASEE